MEQITPSHLIEACADLAQGAGVTVTTSLEPLDGPGALVKPAIYAGGLYQQDRRWVGTGEERSVVDVVVIDNVPSQANRLEAALALLQEALHLPEFVLDLSGVGALPPHLPKTSPGPRPRPSLSG